MKAVLKPRTPKRRRSSHAIDGTDPPDPIGTTGLLNRLNIGGVDRVRYGDGKPHRTGFFQ
jgi:hypothetical protein